MRDIIRTGNKFSISIRFRQFTTQSRWLRSLNKLMNAWRMWEILDILWPRTCFWRYWPTQYPGYHPSSDSFPEPLSLDIAPSKNAHSIGVKMMEVSCPAPHFPPSPSHLVRNQFLPVTFPFNRQKHRWFRIWKWGTRRFQPLISSLRIVRFIIDRNFVLKRSRNQ